MTGDDTEGLILDELLDGSNIDTSFLIKSAARITTNKTRIISRNQQMMRLDAEITDDLNAKDESALTEMVRSFIAKVDPDVLIFEDYNKGVLTEKIIQYRH